MHQPTSHRTPGRGLVTLGLLTLLALVGCDNSSPVAPVPDDDTSTTNPTTAFTDTVNLNDLGTQLGEAPRRIEVDVLPGGPPWVARELEIDPAEDLRDEEKIESHIVAADEAAGTLTIVFGSLLIDVSAARRFRAEGVGDVSPSGFFARVQARLDRGGSPGVELRRPAPADPQAPGDATFAAWDVRLDDDADFAKLELNVDDRHLSVESSTRGTLTLLGVPITLDRASGTSVESRRHAGAFDIEGLVADVNPADGWVLLADGTELFVVAGTRIKNGGGDDRLHSLAEVASKLAAGRLVEAEAEAIVADDGALVALEIEFELEDDQDDDIPGSEEFEGRVASVDETDGTLTLFGVGSFSITDQTRFESDGDLFTVAQIAGALAVGRVVEAEGIALPDAATPTGWRIIEVKVEDDD